MAKKKAAGQGTRALQVLLEAGVPFVEHAYEHDSAETNYGEEAANKLGASADRIFKTLVALVDGEPTVAIVPVTGLLDLKALAKARGAKRAELAPADVAERRTGYILGGISPLGQKTAMPAVLDESAWEGDSVLVSGGRRGLDIELAPEALAGLIGASRAPIARPA